MSLQERIQSFYTGRLYPLLVAALVLYGNLTGLEVYTNAVNVLLICFALLIGRSSRPLLPFFLSFFYQISMQNTPSKPTASDYYFTGWRIPLHLFLVSFLAISLIVFLFRARIFTKRNPFKIPLLIPISLFCISMVLNGLGSAEYVPMNLLWGVGMALVYGLLFYVFYFGMKDEDADELISYFTYLTLILAWILIIEFTNGLMTWEWLTYNNIRKDHIWLGFGVSNLIAFHLVTMIPMCFYGYMKQKGGLFYLVTALILYAFTVLTLSRNSILFGGIILLICIITAMFFGEKRKLTRVLFAVLLLGGIALVYIFREQLLVAFKLLIDKGFDDSSRFSIYEQSYELFRTQPNFGVGFFGLHFGSGEVLPTDLVPQFSHNTVFELLCACGLCGLIGYGIYRLATLRHILHRVTIEKWMLGLAYMTLALQSVLDNYVFQIYTTFYAMAALAILVIYNEERHKPKPIYFLK